MLAYREFWLARPIGEGPAESEVPRSHFDQMWTDRPILLLGVGDSVTAGLGADRPDHSYFSRLARNPPDEW